jgi:UPF0716 protein FxsA
VPVLLVVLFIVVPLVELYVIVQVGQAIGAIPTIAILLLDSVLGAMLLRSQGRAAWRRFNEALEAGRTPAREVFNGAMIIFGGALLLTPGFITDIFGLLLLIPPTRAVIRRLLTKVFVGRFAMGPRVAYWGVQRARGRRGAPGAPPPGAPPRGAPSGEPWGQPPRHAPPPRGRGDEIEGTARELDDDEPEPGAGR